MDANLKIVIYRFPFQQQFYTCNQDGCCFKKWGPPYRLWSNRSYINRLFALSADAIITNYFRALWELNNSVMHHWTFSCFIADGFRGPSAHSNVFNKPPSPSPRGLEAAGYSFSTPGAYSSFPCWEKKAAVFLPALGGRCWTIEEAWCVSQIRERAPGF